MTNIGNIYGPDFTFLGIPRCDLDKPDTYKGADVVIVGAPIDSGTSHRSGAKMGPQAIRMGDYLPHDASPFISTLPYICFSAAMVIGRLLGDRAAHKFGPMSATKKLAIMPMFNAKNLVICSESGGGR